MGFEEVLVEKGYYADGEDAFSMRKDLGPPIGRWVAVEEGRQARLKNKKEADLLDESKEDKKARIRREKLEAAKKDETVKKDDGAKNPEQPAAEKPKADFLAGLAGPVKKKGGAKAGKKKK